MRIFITGITGFVGGHVANVLLDRGHYVTGLVRQSAQVSALEKQGARVVVGELADRLLLTQEVQLHDAVVHAASGIGPVWESTNQQALASILDALKGTDKAFLMQSGTLVFGDTGIESISDQNLSLQPPPSFSSLVDVYDMVLGFQQEDLRPIILSAAFVYGGEGAAIPAIMKKKALEEGHAAFIGSGSNRWSAVHIKDWAQLFALAIESPNAIGHYIASSTTHSMQEYASFVASALNLPPFAVALPMMEASNYWDFFTQPLAAMNQAFYADRAKTELGWHPQFIDVAAHI